MQLPSLKITSNHRTLLPFMARRMEHNNVSFVGVVKIIIYHLAVQQPAYFQQQPLQQPIQQQINTGVSQYNDQPQAPAPAPLSPTSEAEVPPPPAPAPVAQQYENTDEIPPPPSDDEISPPPVPGDTAQIQPEEPIQFSSNNNYGNQASSNGGFRY